MCNFIASRLPIYHVYYIITYYSIYTVDDIVFRLKAAFSAFLDGALFLFFIFKCLAINLIKISIRYIRINQINESLHVFFNDHSRIQSLNQFEKLIYNISVV